MRPCRRPLRRPAAALAAALALLAAVPGLAQAPAKPAAPAPAKPAPTPAAKPGPAGGDAAAAPGVVARVNGAPIPESRLVQMLRQSQAGGQADTPELRRQLRDRLIAQELAAQAAVAAGLDKHPEVLAQIEFSQRDTLANAYVLSVLNRNPLTEAAVRAEYDKLVAQSGRNEYKARHVLVGTEDEAKKIIAELGRGASFDTLAAQSKDAGSAQNGGDLGWAPAEQYVQPFADALVKLGKGQTTQAPVQTQFGWHVIRLDDTRERPVPTFDQVRGQVAQQMQRAQIQAIVRELLGKAKVE
ncbi:MAG: peptidylprolyl isomerase [Burkholderiales bacterium]|nr:peptidylprolyl isomerase [Burkholderiales bacterium]